MFGFAPEVRLKMTERSQCATQTVNFHMTCLVMSVTEPVSMQMVGQESSTQAFCSSC